MSGLQSARQRPMYTPSEAARWAKTSPQTVRRWIGGYTFRSTLGNRWSAPVTSRPRDDLLTFEDLIEVAAVAAARRARVSMPRIRTAVEYAVSQLGVDRPLLTERFRTDGRDLFGRGTTNLSRFGQTAWYLIEEVLKDVDYGLEGLVAIRWWPAGRDKMVLVDPSINFGWPLIAGIGVRTETLVDRFQAGLKLEDVAAEYGSTRDLIEEAVRFENRSGAIAA